MGKRAYFGGSTVVGFSGSFTGKRGGRLTHATDIDAHLTQKKVRDDARQLAEKPKKKKKKLASIKTVGKPSVKNVNIKARRKHNSSVVNVAKKISAAQATVLSIEVQIEKSKQLLWTLERDLHRAKVTLAEAKKLRRTSAEGALFLEADEPRINK